MYFVASLTTLYRRNSQKVANFPFVFFECRPPAFPTICPIALRGMPLFQKRSVLFLAVALTAATRCGLVNSLSFVSFV
jgi:hypothetical protein